MMIKNSKKYIYKNLCLFIFICFFTLFFSKTVLAQKEIPLEATYPEIAGKTVTAGGGLPDLAVYLFYAGMSIGFGAACISLVWGGVLYFLTPIPDLKVDAKDRVSGAISGLLIIFLTYLIITTINPELKNFGTTKLETPEIESVTIERPPGVYLYDKGGCPESEGAQPHISNINNLGSLKNGTESAEIVQDWDNDMAYVSILYEHPNFWGKCHYISPIDGCESQEDDYSSASIYKYDNTKSEESKGTGVYFFRKPCFNEDPSASITDIIEYCKEKGGTTEKADSEKGRQEEQTHGKGYFEVKSSEIMNGTKYFDKKLVDLKFEDVPEDEQDCVKYDKLGHCADGGRQPPSLAGENISSILIDGDYLVLLYNGTADNADMDSCQEFPKFTDINKTGPRQIKWELIRSTSKLLPDSVMIIPVKFDDKPGNNK